MIGAFVNTCFGNLQACRWPQSPRSTRPCAKSCSQLPRGWVVGRACGEGAGPRAVACRRTTVAFSFVVDCRCTAHSANRVVILCFEGRGASLHRATTSLPRQAPCVAPCRERRSRPSAAHVAGAPPAAAFGA